ncbi:MULTISPECIES: PEP-CTERM sorting domain-containing protein [unclassified Okeania]|uniref:PEP-CTERM sorting domain-containing protein n=1 Tax=unclassified Okeania TaxID=2634635 RepID=UPI00257EB4AE|nr:MULTISPECIES: PEP-CTERM sorting domain-containing protein [unclassified Okeania]
MSFGGDTFTNTDIVTPLEEVLAIISTSESDRFLNFSNINPSGSGDFGGSIDFINFNNSSETVLSFEPPGFEGNLDLYFTDSYFGNYQASIKVNDDTVQSTPEPASVFGLLAFGAIGAGSKLKRK